VRESHRRTPQGAGDGERAARIWSAPYEVLRVLALVLVVARLGAVLAVVEGRGGGTCGEAQATNEGNPPDKGKDRHLYE
jgi:hypothetical protein